MSIKEVNGGYVIDFTLNHERYRETIPAPHNKTASKRVEEQEAIYKMAISLNDKAIASRFPNSKIMQKAFDTGCNYTIHDYSNIWFKQKQRNWSHTTIRGYTQKYNSYIKPNWGHLLLSEFKASMFDEWAADSHLSGKSINETRNVLNQIYSRAFYDNVIDTNPIERIERYKETYREPKPFNNAEIQLILSGLRTPYREFYQLAIYSGLRTGELLGLRWQDVDIANKLIHVRVNLTGGVEKEPKTRGSIRSVELHEEAIKALKSISCSNFLDSNRVFVDPKTKEDFKNADGMRKYVWKPLFDKIGIQYRYPYQCRHTYASMMLSKGKNPLWVAKQMGHADWGMIRKTYGRWIP
jgi:integrase